MKKPAAKATAAKKGVKKPAAKKAPGAAEKRGGKSVESMIARRDVDLKSVEDALGIKREYTRNKPIIPGMFDLIIPPGTPRKLIIEMAKEYDLDIVMRDDSYVPIGISDIPRELLCIRGDEKTIRKIEKILLERLKKWAK